MKTLAWIAHLLVFALLVTSIDDIQFALEQNQASSYQCFAVATLWAFCVVFNAGFAWFWYKKALEE